MATSLLRFGRLGSLKRLQLENWSVLKSCPAASFCTTSKEPAKPVKKTKAASKTPTPDERASLLAYRTAVAFPVKLSGLFPAADPDVVPPVAASPAHDVPSEAHRKLSAPKHIPVAASSEGAAVHDSTSSSSSSSESDSDSDSEDEKSEMKTRTRSSAAEAQKVTVTEVKGSTDEGQSGSGSPLTSGVEAAAPLKAAPAAVEAPSVGSEKLENPDPEVCTTTENTRKVSSSDVSARDAAEETKDAAEETKDAAEETKDAAEETKDAAFPADAQVEAAAEAVGEALTSEETQPAPAEAASGHPPDVPPAEVASGAEASVPAGSTEEQVDPDPVVTEGEELQAEATPEHSEEAVAAEPDEPFDNSTYRNYQHHSYTPYTFADLDVEMAKYRLPQPSSGKLSPRH